MTGTALDGNIDFARLRTDGKTIAELGPWTLIEHAAIDLDARPVHQPIDGSVGVVQTTKRARAACRSK